MESSLLISDAAKEVQVESHVLRYWEEELQLPIKRNEQGHRYYTEEDVERFKQIKTMKESGLQLKAIRLLLKDGKFDVLTQGVEGTAMMVDGAASSIALEEHPLPEDQGKKTQRLQWVLQQMIRQAVQENNAELVRQIRESVLKEMDYQFRMQEEREEERDRKVMELAEEHYKKVDELLREKSGQREPSRSKWFWRK